MSRLRKMHDLHWTSSGDLIVDPDTKDLLDTKRQNYQGMIQRALARIQSSKGDWRTSPQTGANIAQYNGLKNNQQVGLELQTEVTNELVRGGFISPNELQVTCFPLSKHELGILVRITPVGQRETIVLTSSYSLADNKFNIRS